MLCGSEGNFFMTDEELDNSPSRADGLDAEAETALRFFGAQMVQEATILLNCPQAVAATGQVLLQRFYCKRSFKQYNVKKLAAAATYLAVKLEECTNIRLHDLILVFDRLARRKSNPNPQEGWQPRIIEHGTEAYSKAKEAIIKYERDILRVFGFILHCDHPHKLLISLAKVLNAGQPLLQEAWNIANDSLRTTLCVRFKSEVIASGVIFYAARRLQVPLPEEMPWWETFSCRTDQVMEVVCTLHRLYQMPRVDINKLWGEAMPVMLPAPPPVESSVITSSVALVVEDLTSPGAKLASPRGTKREASPSVKRDASPSVKRDGTPSPPGSKRGDQSSPVSRRDKDEGAGGVSREQGGRAVDGGATSGRSRSRDRRDRERDRGERGRRRSQSRSRSRDRRGGDRGGGGRRDRDRDRPVEDRRDGRWPERDRERERDRRDGRDRDVRDRDRGGYRDGRGRDRDRAYPPPPGARDKERLERLDPSRDRDQDSRDRRGARPMQDESAGPISGRQASAGAPLDRGPRSHSAAPFLASEDEASRPFLDLDHLRGDGDGPDAPLAGRRAGRGERDQGRAQQGGRREGGDGDVGRGPRHDGAGRTGRDEGDGEESRAGRERERGRERVESLPRGSEDGDAGRGARGGREREDTRRGSDDGELQRIERGAWGRPVGVAGRHDRDGDGIDRDVEEGEEVAEVLMDEAMYASEDAEDDRFPQESGMI